MGNKLLFHVFHCNDLRIANFHAQMHLTSTIFFTTLLYLEDSQFWTQKGDEFTKRVTFKSRAFHCLCPYIDKVVINHGMCLNECWICRLDIRIDVGWVVSDSCSFPSHPFFPQVTICRLITLLLHLPFISQIVHNNLHVCM